MNNPSVNGNHDEQRADAVAPTTHWAQIGESTFVAGMWLLFHVHRVLGRWPFLACLYPVVTYYWLTRPVARRSSLEYLERLHASRGVWSKAPGWRESLRHFRMFAQVILDKMLALSGSYPASRVHIDGHQSILALIARGQGGVLVTAHMGCIELCQVLAEKRDGLRLNVLVHTRHAERFNRVLDRLSPGNKVRFLQVTDFSAATAMMLSERVAAGEFIAIAGDRVPVQKSKTTSARFLGHEAVFPSGPYVIAALLKCPLFLMTCTHAGDGYALRIAELAARVELPRARRDQAIAEYARIYAAAIEDRLAGAPLDWFNFFPFWAQTGDAGAAPARPQQAQQQ
ncbi:LpxL/LpxP family acyltransferase [Diaphorobacter aerolatus]|uniref:Acyltransferase n=1 Tax=Diaphorobacter aerolatus TaxID=1288495 RepID=A0A7H0GM11_9BURK|nr:acyltransferase [Diaphorobacter aerolatus]QNP49327.1 acyltransferase [Diaphorobacter aerolatus]